MTTEVCLVQSYRGLSRLDRGRGDLAALVPEGRRLLSWHLVGDALDWDSIQEILLDELRGLRGIELLALEVSDLSNPAAMDRLARYCRSAGIRLRFDHVLAGPGDERPSSAPSLDRIPRLRSLARGGGPNSRSPSFLAILPVRPDTIGGLFPIWNRLDEEGIPYQVTLGQLGESEDRQRYLILEMLENAAHRASLSMGGRYYCSVAREALSAAETTLKDARVVTIDKDVEAADAVEQGALGLPLPHPPLGWRVSGALRRLKLDKWILLLVGLFDLLISLIDGSRAAAPSASQTRKGRALVIGWYGTETAGDKAILGGILKEMYSRIPELKVTLASMLPFYTRQTLNELGYSGGSDVIPLDHRRINDLMVDFDEVLIGGGPMMDLVEMFDLVRVMHLARRSGVATVIAGCGVGPARWPITRWAIRALLDLADDVVLRDQESKDVLRLWGMDSQKVKVGLDPAINYVAGLSLPRRTRAHRRPVLGLAVRDWPKKFGRSLSAEEFEARRLALPRVWADVCDGFIRAHDGQVRLIPMHTLHIGDDDRWFQARVRDLVAERENILQLVGSYSAEQIAREVGDCDVFLAMRYHSVLFAVTLGVPTVAIDYTRGGKVAAFGRHVLAPEFVFDIATAEASRIQAALGQAFEMRAQAATLAREVGGEFLASACLPGEAAAGLL